MIRIGWGIILRLLELVDPACHELIISGGEPTLLGDDFFRIIGKAKEQIDEASLAWLGKTDDEGCGA